MSQINFERFKELDGLRGIAAIMVFLSHFFGIFYENHFINSIQNSGLRFFWNGDAAVILFFVLSGFVLTFSLIHNKTNYFYFTIKRIFRIFPAYYISIILGIILIKYFEPSRLIGLSSWIQSFWLNKITMKDIFNHIILIFSFNSKIINPVIWSLSVEIKMSLLLPIILIFYKSKFRVLFSIIILINSLILSNYQGLFYYLPEFSIGLVAAINHQKIICFISNLNSQILILFFFISLLLFGNRFLIANKIEYDEIIITHLTGIGAIMLIILVSYYQFIKKILSSKLLDIIGKISYSFYLVHFPVLIFTTSIFYPLINSILLCGFISLNISFIISYLMYNYVELKMINVGKKILILFQK